MREDFDRLAGTGVPLIAMIPAESAQAVTYWQNNKIPITGLIDPEREIMRAYGQEFTIPKLGWMPATIALDSKHRVVYVHYGNGQRDITSTDEILELMGELAA